MTKHHDESPEQTPAPETAETSSASAGSGGPPPSPPPARTVRPHTVAVALAATAAVLWLGTKIGARSSAEGGPSAEASEGEHDAKAGVHYYTCGMHPWVILPHPGPCPICGMPLVPLDPAKFSGEVTIDPVVVQNIGVRVAPVEKGPLVQSIRTVGSITYDETRVRDVNVKIAGWVQKLYVDTLGEVVRKGEPLFELYSPELYAAQEEYLLAIRGGALGGGGKSLRDAARRKLEYYDIPPAEIAALEKRGVPTKTLTLRSPYAGVVTEKTALEGMRLAPGMQVFRIADLSKVWVMVTLYEYQLPFVHVGQDAVVTLPYLPGPELHGKVIYVYPYLDTKARQVQVRIELDNPDLELKPGMYATVSLQGKLDGARTLAPSESVIDTGERQVAFVSKGNGHFEPREVKTGVETDGDMVEILSGLAPGEQVVTSGEFLLDSEARVREALAKMVRGTPAVSPQGPLPAAGQPLAELPEEARAQLSLALKGYLDIGRALASDDSSPVAARASEMAAALERLTAVEIPNNPHFWHEHEAVALGESARALAAANSLVEARQAFARMSEATEKLVRATGVPAQVGSIDELHCPMYAGGAIWLQGPGEVRNPYLGKTMLACFDKRASLPAAAAERPVDP
jgi:Cu(I)/Ag(I) efflux system membrane fusion protein